MFQNKFPYLPVSDISGIKHEIVFLQTKWNSGFWVDIAVFALADAASTACFRMTGQ